MKCGCHKSWYAARACLFSLPLLLLLPLLLPLLPLLMQNYGFQLKHASTFPFPFFAFVVLMHTTHTDTCIASVCVCVCARVCLNEWATRSLWHWLNRNVIPSCRCCHKVSQIFGKSNKAETFEWGLVWGREGRGSPLMALTGIMQCNLSLFRKLFCLQMPFYLHYN